MQSLLKKKKTRPCWLGLRRLALLFLPLLKRNRLLSILLFFSSFLIMQLQDMKIIIFIMITYSSKISNCQTPSAPIPMQQNRSPQTSQYATRNLLRTSQYVGSCSILSASSTNLSSFLMLPWYTSRSRRPTPALLRTSMPPQHKHWFPSLFVQLLKQE